MSGEGVGIEFAYPPLEQHCQLQCRGVEGVADFMRQAGGQRTDRGELGHLRAPHQVALLGLRLHVTHRLVERRE